MAYSKYEWKAAVQHWRGFSYIFRPEEKVFEKAFLFDGINIGTTVNDPERCPTCYDKISREITAYRDPETGEFLNNWKNTMTGKVNEVRPVLNDPVNAKLGSYMPTFTHSHNNPNRFWCGSKIIKKISF